MSDTVVLEGSPVGGFRPGEVIADKYRLEAEIGRGAMGTVWSAIHVTLGQKVAIKLIHAEQLGSNEARLRFGLEAKAAARLKSRYVVQIYDSGHTADGTPYIVMEYLEGQTLEQRLGAQRDVSLGEAVRITTHVGRALARAHSQGIIHRDLKSGNIFIARSDDDELGWVAKVVDFGVAKLTDAHAPSATKTGTIVGTPLFMSPEQIRGASQVDHRADLYSVGMVFYNMVTGSHAFDGPSYSDVLVSICTQTLPSIRHAAPWLPPEVATWFEKACARDRDARFQNADELVDALQQAAGPAGRLTRGSIADDGPSSTLLGHVPPTAGATIQLAASAPVSARGGAARPEPLPPIPPENESLDSGTLRSRSDGTGARGMQTPAVSTQPRPRPRKAGLWLWAAAGVGLGMVTLLIAAAVGSATSGSAGNKPEETRNQVARAETDPVRVPALPQAIAPPPPLPPPPVVPPAVTSLAEPESVDRRSPATESRETTRVRSTRRTVAAPQGTTQAPAEKPAPKTESPPPSRGAPDMGF